MGYEWRIAKACAIAAGNGKALYGHSLAAVSQDGHPRPFCWTSMIVWLAGGLAIAQFAAVKPPRSVTDLVMMTT